MQRCFPLGQSDSNRSIFTQSERVVEKAANNKLLSCSPLFNLRFTESSRRDECSEGGHFRMSPSSLSELSAKGNNYSSIPPWERGNLPIILLLNNVY